MGAPICFASGSIYRDPLYIVSGIVLEYATGINEPIELPKASLCCIDRRGAKFDSVTMAAISAGLVSVDDSNFPFSTQEMWLHTWLCFAYSQGRVRFTV
jgi:hypothetical protein